MAFLESSLRIIPAASHTRRGLLYRYITHYHSKLQDSADPILTPARQGNGKDNVIAYESSLLPQRIGSGNRHTDRRLAKRLQAHASYGRVLQIDPWVTVCFFLGAYLPWRSCTYVTLWD